MAGKSQKNEYSDPLNMRSQVEEADFCWIYINMAAEEVHILNKIFHSVYFKITILEFFGLWETYFADYTAGK